MKRLIILVSSLFISTQSVLAIPEFRQQQIQGVNVQVPQGWQSQSDEYSIILSENPQDEDAAVIGLIAATANQQVEITPRQVSEAIITQIQQSEPTVQIRLIDERDNNQALYQLYQVIEGNQTAYLSSYAYTDSASGSLVYLYFVALEQDFIEMGGPGVPLVVFAGIPPEALVAIQEEVEQNNSWSDLEATAEYYETLSRISAMSHETSMKILHNIGGGWCYSYEPDCY